MKRLFFISTIIIAFTSCDEIDDPIIPFDGAYNTVLYGEPPVLTVSEQTGKNILIEDFTAHQCGNCPQAAIIADDIMFNDPENVFVLAIHAGNLAITNEDYPTNWTCDEGDVFWSQLDFQANPIGRINRIGGPGNFFSPGEWEDQVSSEIQKDTPIELVLETEWHPEAGHLNIHVRGLYFSNEVSGDHRLSILIAESHLIGHQLYYGNDPEQVTDYEFNHLLRGSVTGANGLVAISDPQEGDYFQEDYTFNWNDEWVFENSSIIAIVSNEDGYVINCLGKHLSE
mgnify:CR=1 FL=1